MFKVRNLTKEFKIRGKKIGEKPQILHALSDVSVDIYEGETLGVIGESGCGKSTFGKCLVQLHKATAGSVEYEGRNIFELKGNDLKKLKRDIQMVFQDPFSSLDPRMTAGQLVEEPMIVHKIVTDKAERKKRALELLQTVGLNVQHVHRYPHEFSGGQQQRVGIARALAVKPEFIVCDEPISALDVSIQSQVVNMLEDMQQELGLTYLFIAHDLSVVRHISNRIGVMYLGSLVELGESYELNRNPIHPYTQTLLSAVPVPDPKVSRSRQRIVLEGDIPSPMNPPSGCRFHTRCPYATEKCSQQVPVFKEHEPGHWAACHLLDK